MTAEPPADRPEASGHTTQSSVRADYAYPSDLAKLVLLRWDAETAAGQIRLPAPATSTLAQLLSICYQATLLREEGRPVTFRLAISAPETFDPAAGPPSGVHRLVFSRPLPLDHNLFGVLQLGEVHRERGATDVEMGGEVAGTQRAGFEQGEDLAADRMRQGFEDGIDAHGAILISFIR